MKLKKEKAVRDWKIKIEKNLLDKTITAIEMKHGKKNKRSGGSMHGVQYVTKGVNGRE